jgi:hypothetical protein
MLMTSDDGHNNVECQVTSGRRGSVDGRIRPKPVADSGVRFHDRPVLSAA